MRIEYTPLSQVVRWPRNPKLHALNEIDNSMRRFGFVNPIILDETTGRLVAGHGRIDTLQKMKDSGQAPPLGISVDNNEWLIPVVRGVSFKDEHEAEAYLLADNQLTILGGFDQAILQQILPGHMENLAGIGFSAEELAKILPEPEPKLENDEIPEPPAECVSKLGDLWVCGKHRVLCGDSTKPEDVNKLVGGAKINLLFADPPYGINYKPMRNETEIVGDTPLDALANLKLALSVESETTFICCDWRSICSTTQAMTGAGRLPKACIVWDKRHGVQNLDRYHKQHEFILYAGPFGGQKTLDSDVWQFERDYEPNHPTAKPVELVMRAIATANAETIYDPFLGSGTTLIAAEKLGRTCMGIEIEPRYVDVAVKRWQNLTSRKAVLEATGQTFEQVAKERLGTM